jgi:O-antigen/teichoic acid export membrane protein
MPSLGHKLLSGSALRVGTFFAQLLVTFFLSPFIIHTLGDRLYGFWVLIGSFIGYYGLLDFGLSSAVTRHIAGALGKGDNEAIRRVYNTAVRMLFVIGCLTLLLTIIAILVAPWLVADRGEVPLFRLVMLILGVNMSISLMTRIYIGTLHAQMRFDIVSFVQIGALIVRSSLIVAALLAGYKLLALAWITFFTSTASNFIYLYYGKKILPLLKVEAGLFKRDTATTLFGYSFYLMISQVANQLRFHADSFVIASFLSLSSVTHYSIASTLMMYFSQLVSKTVNVFGPVFSLQEGKGDNEQIKKTLYFASRISVAVSSFIGFGLVAWGSPFIRRWMGPDYLDAYPCLVALVAGMMVFLWQTPAHSYLYATSKHRFLAILNLIEGVANVGLSLVLVRYFGIFGVALGTLCTFSFGKVIVFPIYFSRVSSFTYREYVKNLSLYAAKCGLALIAPMVITIYLVGPDYRRLFLVGALSAMAYGLCSWAILFTQSDREYFIKAFRSVLGRAS